MGKVGWETSEEGDKAMKSKHAALLSFPVCVMLLLIGLTFAESPTSPASDTPDGAMESSGLAPLNPDFIAWREKRRVRQIGALAEEDMGSGLVPSPFDDRYLRRMVSSAIQIAALPGKYDLRSYGWVTPVKDQAKCGACYAFATCSSLESWLSRYCWETWDFSENHIKNYGGADSASPCDGGDDLTTAAYLVRWAGPVLETDDPFHDSSDYLSRGGTVRKYVKSVRRFYDPQDIKNAIMTSGALWAPMYLDTRAELSPYYNSLTNTYYHRGDEELSHAVALIGWDDSKYVPGTSTKGAWLVKNSWGAHLSYFYVSYENRLNLNGGGDICYAVAYRDAVETSSYLHNYQWDEFGLLRRLGRKSGNTETYWGANVFTANDDENLAAVGFWAVQPNTAYEITVYGAIHPTGSQATFSDPLVSESNTAPYFGYYTITLPKPVSLTKGKTFVIVVKLTTPGYDHPLPVELPVEDYASSSQASASPGQSYYSTDGQSFTDITTVKDCSEANVCIKGLTVRLVRLDGNQDDLLTLVETAPDPRGVLASGSWEAMRGEKGQAVRINILGERGMPETDAIFLPECRSEG